MSKKLTRWFPANVNPAREGVYEVKDGYVRGTWHSYWDGRQFNWYTRGGPEVAYDMRFDPGCGYGTKFWRGLASDPGAASS
jgi:hypothetical protein